MSAWNPIKGQVRVLEGEKGRTVTDLCSILLYCCSSRSSSPWPCGLGPACHPASRAPALVNPSLTLSPLPPSEYPVPWTVPFLQLSSAPACQVHCLLSPPPLCLTVFSTMAMPCPSLPPQLRATCPGWTALQELSLCSAWAPRPAGCPQEGPGALTGPASLG